MTKKDFAIIEMFLGRAIATNEHCEKCAFRHKDDRGYFCFFAYECLKDKNKYNVFKKRLDSNTEM